MLVFFWGVCGEIQPPAPVQSVLGAVDESCLPPTATAPGGGRGLAFSWDGQVEAPGAHGKPACSIPRISQTQFSRSSWISHLSLFLLWYLGRVPVPLEVCSGGEGQWPSQKLKTDKLNGFGRAAGELRRRTGGMGWGEGPGQLE